MTNGDSSQELSTLRALTKKAEARGYAQQILAADPTLADWTTLSIALHHMHSVNSISLHTQAMLVPLSRCLGQSPGSP